MPITTNYQQLSYAGDGVTNSFPVVWQYQLQTDLVVHTLDTSTNTTTLLVLGTDYTVSPTLNSPANTGTVVTTTPPPALTNLLIARSVPLTQETTWVPNDPNLSTSTMNAVDKLTEIAQQLSANPFGLTGTSDQFLRGDNVLTNTLIGALGTPAIPADTTALFIAGQNADASIKVVGGSTSQAAFSFGTDGSANPWDARWVFDPQIAELGWQFYGGPILGTFDGSGNVSISGTYAGSADASLITSGVLDVARVGTGSGAANTFLNGAGDFAIPASGGGINTTTTGTFVIAAANLTQTVPVTDATGIVVGAQLQIGDGTNILNGHVTAVASLNLTVSTDQIVLGTAGNTMASGAAVQGAIFPGNNSVLFGDSFFSPTPATSIVLVGDQNHITGNGTSGNANVHLWITNGPTSNPIIQGYFNGKIGYGQLGYNTLGGPNHKDYLALFPATAGGMESIPAVQLQASSAGLVVNSYTSGSDTKIQFSKIDGSSSINASTITPALLNCTNSLTDQYVFGYDSGSGNFKMFSNTGLPTATNTGQFLRGDGAYSSILNLNASSGEGAGEFILANGVADNSYGVAFFGQPSGGTLAAWTMQKRVSGGWGVPTGVWTNYVIGVDGGTASVGSSWVSIDSTHAESLYLPLIARTDAAVRDVYGPLHKIYDIDMSGQSGTYPIDLINGAFQRMHGFTGTVTISLADTTPLPSNGAFRYESELTLEVVDPGANIVGWAASGGSVVWANGASAPTLATTGKNVVKFVRSQDQTYWIGTYVQPATGTGTVTSITAGSGLTGGTITTTGTLSIASGGVTASMIANNTITNSQISASANIATTKLALPGTSSPMRYLDGTGNWSVPPGTGGAGGGPTLAGTQTWTGVNTYSNNNIFNGQNAFNGPQAFTSAGFGPGIGTNATCYVGINSYPSANSGFGGVPDAAGIAINMTNSQINKSVEGLSLFLDNTTTGASSTIRGYQIDHDVGASEFRLAFQMIQDTYKMQSGAFSSDVFWLVTSSPDSNVSGNVYNSGFCRIGEVNYGNAWADFGFIDDRVNATQAVAGIEFFPWWNGATFGDANNIQYPVQWAIAIGGSGPQANNGSIGRHWTGILGCAEGITPGGVWMNLHGGAISTTTTGTFTVAAVGASQVVPVTSASAIVAGTNLRITDGTHDIEVRVTSVVSLNVTAVTETISAGAGGNTMGSSAVVTSAPAVGINFQKNYTTGINFAGSAGGAPIGTGGGTAATFLSTGNAAITMADDQSIKLGSIWLRGHSGALQYSTNGTAWSNVTLP